MRERVWSETRILIAFMLLAGPPLPRLPRASKEGAVCRARPAPEPCECHCRRGRKPRGPTDAETSRLERARQRRSTSVCTTKWTSADRAIRRGSRAPSFRSAIASVARCGYRQRVHLTGAGVQGALESAGGLSVFGRQDQRRATLASIGRVRSALVREPITRIGDQRFFSRLRAAERHAGARVVGPNRVVWIRSA